jgi:nicotinate-nucleotide adenylyltransferase
MSLYTPPHLLDSRWRGMRIGLLGGSFNPPHAGHIHISEVAIKRLGLDYVWWMVTPQNPFKTSSETPPFEQRLEWCQTITKQHPKLIVSDLEQRFGTFRTVASLKNLNRRFAGVEFVFLIGSDLVKQFSRWEKWRDIPKLAPIAIIPRPPALDTIRFSPIAGMAGQNRIFINQAKKPVLSPGTLFDIRNGPMNPLSSTMIRNHYKTND